MTVPAQLRGLKQPDQRTCGPSSVVAARMLVDPAYRPADFGAAALSLHRALTSNVAFGAAQLPWPAALGTPPWAVARALSSYTGLGYRTRVVRFGSRAGEYAAVRAAVSAGRPCPLYVGSAWLPRHVVLAVAPTADGLEVYDPARGSVEELTRTAFTSGRLTTFRRWTRPWFAVLPTG